MELKFLRGLILPAILIVSYRFDLIAFFTLVASLLFIAVLFFIFPIFFKYSVGLQRLVIFLNNANWPKTFDNPEELTSGGARNFYIKYHSDLSNQDIKLGVWHLLPHKYRDWKETKGNKTADDVFDTLLTNGQDPIILYVHGNSFNRAKGHRLELYEVFQSLHYHVIAFDYRGYGDSSNISPSELGVVEDTLMMYKWLLKKLKNNYRESNDVPIYIWGHSLGTGISMHSFAIIASELSLQTINNTKLGFELRQPNGIFLESPFSSMLDELQCHFLAKIFNWLPWYDWIVEGIKDNNLTFSSDIFIPYVASPILIMHAKDDFVVPFQLGKKLYNIAKSTRRQEYGEVEFLPFDYSEGLGHKYICRAKQLPTTIRVFIEKYNETMLSKLQSEDMPKIIWPEERNILLNNLYTH